MDLFDCAESLYSAVEVTAGGSLFHVVVDSDVTASTIMRYLIAQRVGRITCLPLNKLNVSRHSRANASSVTIVVHVLGTGQLPLSCCLIPSADWQLSVEAVSVCQFSTALS